MKPKRLAAGSSKCPFARTVCHKYLQVLGKDAKDAGKGSISAPYVQNRGIDVFHSCQERMEAVKSESPGRLSYLPIGQRK